MIIIEKNNTLRKFFRANEQHEAMIRQNLQTVLPVLLSDKPYKIKTVAGYRYLGQTIYEYKIPLDKNTDCRVAYIHQGEDIRVFLSPTPLSKKNSRSCCSK